MKKSLSLLIALMMILSLVSVTGLTSAAQTTEFIKSGDTWSYYEIYDDSETIPEGWYTEGFDVSAWTSGASPFTGDSYPNNNANTQFAQQGRKLQAYFVKTFVAEDPSSYEVFTMDLYYDEDVSIYLNGEAFFEKSNYNNVLEEFDVTDKKDMLKKGTNTIAVLMNNASTGYGFHFDMNLSAGEAPEPPASVGADGSIAIKSIERVGFADFGTVNSTKNLLDGDVNSCSGSGWNPDAEQYFVLNFYEELEVVQIYLQCKGVEDNAMTAHEDGITYGYYNVYVDDVLVGENVPAISNIDGGYTLELETPAVGSSVKVEIVKWFSDNGDGKVGYGNWANLADITIWNTTDLIVLVPTGVELNKTALELVVGQTETLTATVQPEGAETGFTWVSYNEDVATVDAEGKVSAVSAGTAIISVTTDEGFSASCIVTVTEGQLPPDDDGDTTPDDDDTTTEPDDDTTTPGGDDTTTEPDDDTTTPGGDDTTTDSGNNSGNNTDNEGTAGNENETDDGEDGSSTVIIIVAAVAAVLVIAAVVVVILKKKK